MDDLISRQAAIDAMEQAKKQYFDRRVIIGKMQDIVSNQPSAQSEIITCKDCVHSDTFPKGADNDMPLKCLDIRYGGVMPDWYCEHAERREDG